MAKICERKLFLTAWNYCEEHHRDELEWAKSVNEDTFKNIKPEEFLRNYFWILCNGCRPGVFDQIFLALASVMKDHDIAQLITAKFSNLIEDLIYQKPALDISLRLSIHEAFHRDLYQISIIKDFLEGSKMILDEGFEKYKERLTHAGRTKDRIAALAALPGIDSKKSSRLVKSIGLVDAARVKPDIWLECAAFECSDISIGGLLDGFSGRGFSGRAIDRLIGKDSSIDNLVDYLCEEFDCSYHVVDFVFWRYGKRALSMYDYASIEDKENAEKLFFTAYRYCEIYRHEQLEWAESVNEDTFKNMKSKEFLRNYFWVVFASDPGLRGFEDFCAELEAAFEYFDITALSKVRSIKPVLDDFDDDFDDHKKKAKCFLKGAKMIANEGFETYKKRLKKEGIDVLEELPDIDSTTKSRLARNIGLTDTVEEEKLVDYLSRGLHNRCSRHVVDFVLWRYEVEELEIDFAENYEILSDWWN